MERFTLGRGSSPRLMDMVNIGGQMGTLTKDTGETLSNMVKVMKFLLMEMCMKALTCKANLVVLENTPGLMAVTTKVSSRRG